MNSLRRTLRWDALGLLLIALLCTGLVFALDTGKLFAWIASQKHSKLDEIIVSGVTFLALLTVLLIARWVQASSKLIAQNQPVISPTALVGATKREIRRDLI